MPNSSEIIAHIDGGSRGNPGPAAYGVAIESVTGEPITAFGKYIGRTTNNVAEYNGLLAALEFALSHEHPRLRVLTDSELMAHQINGRYKVRSPDLKPLFDKAKGLISRLESFSIRHVYREQNREADRLANQAMDDAASGKAHCESAPSIPKAMAASRHVASPQISNTGATISQSAAATIPEAAPHSRTQMPLFGGEEADGEIHRKK